MIRPTGLRFSFEMAQLILLCTFQAGLQHRLSEQETMVSELKSNLLHKDFQQQNFDSEKVRDFVRVWAQNVCQERNENVV